MVTRIVADTGIQAAQRPIKLLVPAVAAIYSLRTVGLALQILVENEMFRNTNKVASGSLRCLCLIFHHCLRFIWLYISSLEVRFRSEAFR